METIAFFLAGVVLSLLFSVAIIATLRKSYSEIVGELCGTTRRAGYWIKTSEACIVVITLFVAITFHSYRGMEQPDAIALFWGLMRQVAWILAAIFLCLIVISLVVLRSLPHQANQIQLPSMDLPQGH
jgi:hypothetical protein